MEENLVLEWVFLVDSGSSWLVLSSVEGVLDLVRVDDLGDVWVLQEVGAQSEAGLELRGAVSSSVDIVQSSDGAFSPDAESAEVTSGSEVSDVESVDVEEVNTGDVSDGSGKSLALVVTDNQRTSSVLESSVSELALASSDLSGESDSVDVLIDLESGEKINGFLGSGDLVDSVIEDERELWDTHNSVTSSENEGSHSGGGDGGSQGVSSLLEVDLSVPSSPSSEWVDHSTATAHVTVGTLARSGGSGTSHSRNSGNGSSGTPGERRGLHTSKVFDSVGLSGVLGDVVVDEGDDIVSEGSTED